MARIQDGNRCGKIGLIVAKWYKREFFLTYYRSSGYLNRIRIIAYPAKEYLEGLSDRTREDAKKVYREASAADSIMLFVRDEKRGILRSYIFPRSDVEEAS